MLGFLKAYFLCLSHSGIARACVLIIKPRNFDTFLISLLKLLRKYSVGGGKGGGGGFGGGGEEGEGEGGGVAPIQRGGEAAPSRHGAVGALPGAQVVPGPAAAAAPLPPPAPPQSLIITSTSTITSTATSRITITDLPCMLSTPSTMEVTLEVRPAPRRWFTWVG